MPRDEIPVALLVGLLADFGSVVAWLRSFQDEAAKHPRSQGRVALELSTRDGRLRNRAYEARDASPIDDCAVVLLTHETNGRHDPAIDDRFDAGIDWANVGHVYQRAVHAASASLATDALDGEDPLLLDVRRESVFDASDDMIDGATWYDPTSIESWGPTVATDRPVIAYCVAGHEVSRKVAIRLRSLGYGATFLAGGIDRWKAAGRPTTKKGRGLAVPPSSRP